MYLKTCRKSRFFIYVVPMIECLREIKAYIWFIMDAASRSIIGYQVSDNRSVNPCILSMRMAFRHLKNFPKISGSSLMGSVHIR